MKVSQIVVALGFISSTLMVSAAPVNEADHFKTRDLDGSNLIAAVEVLQNHGLGESQSYSALDRRGTLGSVLVGGTLAAIGAAGSAYLAYRLATQKKEAEDELLLNAARNLDDFDLLG